MKKLLHEITYVAIDTTAKRATHSHIGDDVREMRVVSASGILMDSRRNWSLTHSERLPERCKISDIADASGEWTALAADTNGRKARYVIFGDRSGFSPVFYSLLPQKAAVISDSFNGVVQGLTKLGASPSLNIRNYLTIVTGKTATFDTLVSSETMAEEIHILKPDEALFVDHDSVKVFSRSSLSLLSEIVDYKQALSLAIEQTSQTIQNFVSTSENALPLLTLTGGVDSRLVLALLTQTDVLRRFKVWTMDPRKSRNPNEQRVHTADVEIANQIRRSYRLQWMSPRRKSKFSVSVEESLARHQSFNSNFSFKFLPSKHLTLVEHKSLTLRGGGGELLRGTTGARLTEARYEKYRQGGGKLTAEAWTAKDYLGRSPLSDALRPLGEEFLREQFSASHTSLRMKIDTFYRETRNRAHFGHHRVSAGVNDYIMQVLSNPHLQRVHELADYDYVSSNGIVLDLFTSTEPKLRKFPFESDEANKILHTPSRRGFKYKNRDSWSADFDLLGKQASPYPFLETAEPGMRGEDISRGIHAVAKAYIEEGFKILESLAPREFRGALERQHSTLISQVSKGNLSPGGVMAKVASAIDLVLPMPLDNARHFYTDLDSSPRIAPRNSLQNAASSYADVVDGWTKL